MQRAFNEDEYPRYGRQLILPELGPTGQFKLKESSVVIIGVGGLGCPAATYLAGAGVGRIGLVDGDDVEISNLHRQTLHSTETVGLNKVESAIITLKKSNPLLEYRAHKAHVSRENIISILGDYDIVLDCTDHPAPRYLISDACILLQKPLVSASALKLDGQLVVLNNPPSPAGDVTGGPCYRCVFPEPPPHDSIVSCGEGGILGPVVGLMGVLQALEAIKILTADQLRAASPSLLMFSTFASPQFRSIRLRGRRPTCEACSSVASITLDSIGQDYARYCAVPPTLKLLPDDRMLPIEYLKLATESSDNHPNKPHPDFDDNVLSSKSGIGSSNSDNTNFSSVDIRGNHLLVDVREEPQFEIGHLANSINIPWSAMSQWKTQRDIRPDILEAIHHKGLVFICRYGNDSQLAVHKVIEILAHSQSTNKWPLTTIKDVIGGFQGWRETVDPSFPNY